MSKYVVKKEIFAEKVAKRPLPNNNKKYNEIMLKKQEKVTFPTTRRTRTTKSILRLAAARL